MACAGRFVAAPPFPFHPVGAARATGDEWPVQVSKYGDYPKKMLESCKEIKAKRVIITPGKLEVGTNK